ncbi:MAG: MG2 domain-containing protein [Bacteroidota bacterium]|nr:MG2 domain-containing protein [Bacteroidota bacterium]
MPLKHFPLKKTTLLLAFVLYCSFAAAQGYKKINARIDSLMKAGLPKSALVEVDKLDKLAQRNKNTPVQVQVVLYRIALQYATDENAQVAIINRLRKDVDARDYPVKPILQSLLASMYQQYYQQNRWQFAQRTAVEKPGDDFTTWDLQTLIDHISGLFKLSLKDYKLEQTTPISVLDGVLVGDKANRYLRPTLYDLLAQRALDYFLSEEPAITRPKQPFTLSNPLLFGDSRAFANLQMETKDYGSTFYQGIKLLQQATLFHLEKQNEDALADLDLLRLEFVYTHGNVPNQDSLYLKAVDGIASKFSSSPISADAWVLHGKYVQQKDSLKTALIYYSKAAAAFPKSLGGKNAAGLIAEIKRKTLSASTEDVNMPGKPILAQLAYRNIKTVHLTIYKVWATQYNELARLPTDDGNTNNDVIQTSTKVLNYLKKLTPVKVEDLQLPDPQDYPPHTTEFKINPLQKGIYLLVINDPSSNDPSLTQLTTFKVSQLSFTARRNADSKLEVSVMDRETGSPMQGVNVTIAETEHQTTDANGLCFATLKKDNGYSVKLTTANDTLYIAQRYSGYYNDNNNSNTNTILFTDRQIYRPGQTVYFKGLHIQTKNGKSTLLFNEKRIVTVRDGNNKELVSIPVSSNDFGSFSGTFIIPQNILNGSLSINASDGSKYVNVEEYKRPTFSVAFTPVQHSYKPNDSVTLKGTVTAYSGYGISQAKVAYHVTRQPQIINYYAVKRFGNMLNRNIEIATDTIKTNDRGEFTIKFKAATDETLKPGDVNYRFAVNADVTDGSGETRSANTSTAVAVNNLQVIADVPATIKDNDSTHVAAKITNLDGVMQSGSINLKVYSLKAPGYLFKTKLWEQPDQKMLTEEQYRKDFPNYAYGKEDSKENWATQNTITEINKDSDGKKVVDFDLGVLKKQPTGYYKIIVNAKGEHGDTTSSVNYVYVINEPARPQLLTDWVTPIKTSVKAGKPAEFLIGIAQPAKVLIETLSDAKVISMKWLTITGDKQQLIKVPVDTGLEKITVQFLMVSQNRLYTNRYLITNENYNDQLNIKFLTFRNKLQPGEKEQWKLQITGSNKEKEAAEMVADLYDASLDALTSGADNWSNMVNSRYAYEGRFFYWDNNFINQVQTQPLKYNNDYFNPTARSYEQLIVPENGGDANQVVRALSGRIAGVKIRGASSAAIGRVAFSSAIVKEDTANKQFYGYSDQAAVLQELKVADPGSKNLKEVRINGKDFLAGDNITTRKNFNETAFFYSQLQTNEKGEIVIDFTIPESLTKWQFKGFAHTKDLKTGYIESQVVTQKELSITANTPRFLREGDTIVISARLANLTASKLKGKVQLQLFNALNMQPVSLFANADDAQQKFEVDSNANRPVSFKLFIPAGLSAITYRLTAESGNYSDGEENTLPVLPNRMLVTESMPMMVRAGQSQSFNFDRLINQNSTTLQNKTLTLEYTQNPAWYAVQALPYMMDFTYECSEQVFNRYYANSLATNLVNKMPVIKQVFDQWKSVNSTELLSNLEKNEELKSTLIEETPWLKDAVSESEQKKRIALLFDLNKMSYEMQTNLDKLQKKQLPDGGFPWFGGNYADRYITQNVLAGIGQLYHLGIADPKNQTIKGIADKAMAYLDKTLLADAAALKKNKTFDKRVITPLEIHAYYTQSYFIAREMSADVKALLRNYLQLAAKQWVNKGVYEKGMIALTMQRNQKPEVAQAIMKSLMETAQQTEDMGMYWAKNQRGYYWYESPVETQSLLIELFTEAGNNPKAVEEMKIWLLRSKQTSNWQTTKATAAACYALLMKGDNWLADQAVPEISLGGKNLTELKPDVKADAGTGYIKTAWVDEQVKSELGKVQINNTGKTISYGALHWQYLENLDKITPSSTEIHLERKYFIVKQGNAGQILTAVDATHQPKTGDLLKVVVYLKAGRSFEYVQLKDMRPSGTEPVDVLSNYKYQDGLYYYQVTKDVATNFFISNLNKGNYVFEYQLRVSQPGNFSTGISTVQCMYAPEFNAHSEGMRMEVKP